MTVAAERFDDDRLDRLVDGELSDAEYGELLRSLERQPGGWRACALAFLEAQAWRRDMGAMRGVPESRPPVRPVAQPVGPASRSWTTLLTLAASFLLVFALGVAFHAQWSVPGAVSPQLADESRPASPPDSPRGGTPAAPALAGQERRGPADHSLAGDHRRSPADQSAIPSGNLRVLVGDGDGQGAQAVEVPLYEWTPGMLPQPVQIPPEVQRALQRMGRQLRWERQYVPLNLEGGRRAVLPVEQLEVTPVEHALYQ